MNLVAFDIPEDPMQLAHWLEKQITGLQLGRIVAELSAVHSTVVAHSPELPDLLGDSFRPVLQKGLSILPQQTLRSLLLHPHLLLELQELVLQAGGEYWDTAAHSTDNQLVFEKSWARMRRFLENAQPTPETLPLQQRSTWSQKTPIFVMALAAAILLGVFAYQQFLLYEPQTQALAQIGWGWNKPGVAPIESTPAEYLKALANAATDWFNKRPESAEALAQRLGEMRLGCSHLILARHEPLAKEDQDWLRERCRAWAAIFDKQLTAIESGRDPIEVRTEIDETVNKLVTALSKRAEGSEA